MKTCPNADRNNLHRKIPAFLPVQQPNINSKNILFSPINCVQRVNQPDEKRFLCWMKGAMQ